MSFIDIGTNSIRLLVVRLHRDCTYQVLTRRKEAVRLGEGEFQEHCIKDEAIERAVVVCRKFTDLAQSFGAEEHVAVATSATREARNRNFLLYRLRHEAHLDVRVISGEEEARLIYLGVASNTHLGEDRTLFMDIGGGSTELSIGDQHSYDELASLPLGSIRLTNLFFPRDFKGPVSRKQYDAVRRHIQEVIAPAVPLLTQYKPGKAIGGSGTIINLAEIAARTGNRRSADPMVLERSELSRVVGMLCSLPLSERRNVPGINPERGDIIVAGAAILDCLMETFSIRTLDVTMKGLQDGLLADYLSRMEGFPLLGQLSVRERSVLQLARSCGVNEFHSRTVTRLALELFDSSRDAGLHSYSEKERELFLYATFLHDVGSFISYLNHHIHSHYIISNSDMPGFSPKEVQIMANIARFHRKKVPGKKELAMSGLPVLDQNMVMALIALVRMAESLDRSHTALIRHAEFVDMNKKKATLLISALGDCQLELWGIEHEATHFPSIFGRTLEFKVCRTGLNEIHERKDSLLPSLLNHTVSRE